jgi:8-oxo-dGTP pyrophosphatase MutT (NUDIX family)
MTEDDIITFCMFHRIKNVVEGEKHFTSSVWILSKTSPKKILLIHHKKLGKWVQPGGHIESFENPVEAAIREVKEETGLDIKFLRNEIEVIDEEVTFLPIPKFLMEQTIPAKNDQPRHFHIDINYVAEIPEQSVRHRMEEAHGIGWFLKEEALQLPILEDTKVIIHKLM